MIGPEAVHTRVVDGLLRRFAGVGSLAREVHDHDSVFLHDAHQHEHADERVERCLLPEDERVSSPPTSAVGRVESTVRGCT